MTLRLIIESTPTSVLASGAASKLGSEDLQVATNNHLHLHNEKMAEQQSSKGGLEQAITDGHSIRLA